MRFANLNILAAALSAAVLNAAAESLPFAARGFEASKRAGIMLTPVGAETWDFSGVGEVLGLTQQTVVQTFNFGDAFTNLITPVSSVLMASIGYAGISLDRWLKFAWKWLLVFILIGAAFIILGTAIHYGPF